MSLIWLTFIFKINRETINVLNDVIQHRLLSCSKLRSDSWQKRSRVFLKCPLSHYCSFIYLLLLFKNILFLFCLLLQSGAIVHCPNQLLLSKTKTAGTTQTVPYHQRKRFLWSAHYYLLGPSIISRWFVDISPHKQLPQLISKWFNVLSCCSSILFADFIAKYESYGMLDGSINKLCIYTASSFVAPGTDDDG